MRKWNHFYLKLSIAISIILPMFIPSKPLQEGILKYEYGLPFNYITFYQQEEASRWFLNNFFSGNAGLSINFLTFIGNVMIVYFITEYCAKLLNRAVKGNSTQA